MLCSDFFVSLVWPPLHLPFTSRCPGVSVSRFVYAGVDLVAVLYHSDAFRCSYGVATPFWCGGVSPFWSLPCHAKTWVRPHEQRVNIWTQELVHFHCINGQRRFPVIFQPGYGESSHGACGGFGVCLSCHGSGCGAVFVVVCGSCFLRHHFKRTVGEISGIRGPLVVYESLQYVPFEF